MSWIRVKIENFHNGVVELEEGKSLIRGQAHVVDHNPEHGLVVMYGPDQI